MSTCQGDVPITTKVDEQMREFVDGLADEIGVSRTELLRRMLEIHEQAENGNLVCPACTHGIIIRLNETELDTVDEPIAATEAPLSESGLGVQQEITDVPPERDSTTTSGITHSDKSAREVPDNEQPSRAIPNGETQHQFEEIQSVVEDQQQELENLRRKVNEHQKELSVLSESEVSIQRIAQLESDVVRHDDTLAGLVPRIEALTAVSSLVENANCPGCGSEVVVEESYIDLGEPAAVKCRQCGLVVGNQA